MKLIYNILDNQFLVAIKRRDEINCRLGIVIVIILLKISKFYQSKRVDSNTLISLFSMASKVEGFK